MYRTVASDPGMHILADGTGRPSLPSRVPSSEASWGWQLIPGSCEGKFATSFFVSGKWGGGGTGSHQGQHLTWMLSSSISEQAFSLSLFRTSISRLLKKHKQQCHQLGTLLPGCHLSGHSSLDLNHRQTGLCLPRCLCQHCSRCAAGASDRCTT